MEKITVEIGIVVALLGITYVSLVTYVEQRLFRYNSYMTMSLVKEQRLATLKGPKLILVGGSNLLFGFDSDLLQKNRQAKVVNMGLNAGLGLAFALNETIEQVRSRDTVILCPEYYVETGVLTSQVELNAANPTAQAYFNYTAIDKIRFYTTRLQKIADVSFAFIGERPYTPKTYRVENMNKFGDIKQVYPEDKKPVISEEIFTQSTYDGGIALLNKFIDTAKARGAVVYFTFPPLCESEFNLNKASLTSLENLLRKKLHCKLLGTAKSFSYPDTFFFDTIYHLNARGKLIRTKQLIQLVDAQ